MEDGLQRKKRTASMRRVQAVALDLFELRGFSEVTVEDIAAAAEVSAPTIYRHFGTKEQLVLWDEYDPLLFAAVRTAKRGPTLLATITAAMVRAVDTIYGSDGSRILRRTRLIRAEPALRDANASALASMRDGLADALLRSGASRDEMEAEVVAGAVAIALEAAVRRWEQSGGTHPLAAFIRGAMRCLRSFEKQHGTRSRAITELSRNRRTRTAGRVRKRQTRRA